MQSWQHAIQYLRIKTMDRQCPLKVLFCQTLNSDNWIDLTKILQWFSGYDHSSTTSDLSILKVHSFLQNIFRCSISFFIMGRNTSKSSLMACISFFVLSIGWFNSCPSRVSIFIIIEDSPTKDKVGLILFKCFLISNLPFFKRWQIS